MRSIKNRIELIQRWFAWQLPRGIVHWAFYRVLLSATSGRYSKTLVPGLPWETVIERWNLADEPCCPAHPTTPCDENYKGDKWCYLKDETN